MAGKRGQLPTYPGKAIRPILGPIVTIATLIEAI